MNQNNNKKIFLVTGGAGYVGKILIQKLINDSRVEKIIVIDKENLAEELKKSSKVIFIHKNLVDDWEEEVQKYNITKVVHLAWQIRTMYGKEKLQNKWNIGGSQKVFEFVKNTQSVNSLVHFSTVASYGAFPTNSFEKYFTEENSFRKTDYLYAEEKRIVEERLDLMFGGAGEARASEKNIFVIRPASIAGARGRERTGFGLQSALSGKISSGGLLFKIISKILQFMPATTGWARQFVHEDDIVRAILTMSFSDKKLDKIEKYNLCPTPGRDGGVNYIGAYEMGELLNKKVIFFHPRLVQILCFFAWHGTRGKIPTSTGVWKAYSYPILVDGSKILKDFKDFKYQKTIVEAYKDK